MRKLGMWSGPTLAAALLVAGLTGLSAGPASAQDRAVPWLGVSTQSLDDGLREGLDYQGEGVLVSQVVSDSPAERAGIKKGDILISVNSRGVESPRELTDLIRGARVGQSTTIVLSRDGQRRTVTARLVERPDDADLPDMDGMGDLPRRMREMGPMMRWRTDDRDPDTFVFRGLGRGRLGVRVEDLKGDLGSYFDAPAGQGVLIVEVLEDTPAERAGLKAGDVVTRVGNRGVKDSEDLVSALRAAPKGKVTLTVVRKGATRTIEAELEDAPRTLRVGPGREGRIVIPDVQRELRRSPRSGSGDTEEEVRQLREEVRQLREKLDRLEADRD